MPDAYLEEKAREDEKRVRRDRETIMNNGIAQRLADAAGHDVITTGELKELNDRITEVQESVAWGLPEMERVHKNRAYTDKYKKEQIEFWEKEADERFEYAKGRLQESVTRVVQRAENVRINPPTEDPVLLEARLANARNDALLELSEHSNPATLPATIEEMATRGDDDLTYLLLETRWVDSYLRRKRQEKYLTLWQDRKNRAAGRLLGKSEKTFEATNGLSQLLQLADGLKGRL
jgi:hypothetical protein